MGRTEDVSARLPERLQDAAALPLDGGVVAGVAGGFAEPAHT